MKHSSLMSPFLAFTRLVVSTVVLLATATMTHGCGKGCTEEGCTDGLVVAFRDPPLIEDEITIHVTADDVLLTCSRGPAVPKTDCDEAGLWLQEDTGRVDEVIVAGQHPVQVSVRLVVGGTQVVDATVTPTYATVAPNGPDCPPTCEYARVEL